MKRISILLCILALGLGMAACDNDPVSGDAGPLGRQDATTSDPGVPLSAWEVALVSGVPAGTEHDVDIACVGMATAPAASGSTAAFPFQANSNGTATPAITLQFFQNNQIPSDVGCVEGCVEIVSAAEPAGSGEVMLDSTAWFAYRSLAAEGDEPTIAVTARNVSPEEAGISVSAIVEPLLIAAFEAGGVERRAATAIVLSSAVDCAGHNLGGVRFRLFDGDTEVLQGAGPSDPQFVYWPGTQSPGALPGLNLEHTEALGRFAAVNIDPRTTLRVEAWSLPPEGEEAVLLGCEEVDAFADTVNIVTLGPLRSDGPAGCGG